MLGSSFAYSNHSTFLNLASFLDKVYLCGLGWPQTHGNPPVSVSEDLES